MENAQNQKVKPFSLFSEFDIYLFKQGKHYKLYEKLGSHLVEHEGQQGVYFAVWAPNANRVNVVGDFNFWNDNEHPLNARWDGSGIWEGFIPNIGNGTLYKYKIHSNHYGLVLEKADPFAFFSETPPKTASIVWDLKYEWKDTSWMQKRKVHNSLDQPYSIYEVHLGSWKRKHEDNFRSLHYTELADELVKYVADMGFTHVELMPIMEHPLFASWGYQVTGFFAPTARFGTPQEFMYLVDKFHEAGIGIILDWVPSHFPGDGHGLYKFDGSHLFEHADNRQGYHPDWSSYIFNYGRNEVKSFLISSALFWLDKYHADGFRVDAVASMLYLDYSRKEGEWIPNKHGGRENLEAIDFLRELNISIYQNFPDVQTLAEESTAWTGVSRPTYVGGLGFGMKWMMGWMHDTLMYFSKQPVHRKFHQGMISFSLIYAFTENFLLPLSHDEVAHGKGSLVTKMPGDEWQRFANLRLMFSYMFTHPGAKLLFMGGEIGQTSEWQHDAEIHWDLLQYDPHKGVQALMKDLNKLYKEEDALHQRSFDPSGFEWVDLSDYENSVMIYLRKAPDTHQKLVVIANFTPVVRENYRIGLDNDTQYLEIFNSDDKKYWGSGVRNTQEIKPEKKKYHGRTYSASITLPPLGLVVLKPMK
jgi:1,4-alpha-glucan branching enzyme